MGIVMLDGNQRHAPKVYLSYFYYGIGLYG
jgi:hypothetical protein